MCVCVALWGREGVKGQQFGAEGMWWWSQVQVSLKLLLNKYLKYAAHIPAWGKNGLPCSGRGLQMPDVLEDQQGTQCGWNRGSKGESNRK